MISGNSGAAEWNGSGDWHALHIRHQHEKAVAQALSSKGFETFLPLYPAVHRWKDRTRQLSLPVFPCYLFLRGGLDRRLQILQTHGVQGVVGTAGRPGFIPEAEIAAIQRAVENRLTIGPHPFLQCGDWVRIKSGPLLGLEGILVRKQEQVRLVLSIEILGRSVAVEVEASLVERISKPKNGRIPVRDTPLSPSTLSCKAVL